MTVPRFMLRVLIVGDSEEPRSDLRRVLQKIGITSTQTSTADGALRAAAAMKPDVIIIDTDESRSPLTLIKELRRSRDPSLARTPALLVVGVPDRDFIQTARDLGADALLLKPVISTMLRQRIEGITTATRRFVRSTAYVGPDRRRRSSTEYSGPQRRKVEPPPA